MNIRQGIRKEAQVQTGALNDLLFILLFFFLIVATMANPNVIKLTNPQANSDDQVKQTVVVSINDQQQFFVGTSVVDSAHLQDSVAAALNTADTSVDKSVIINADKLATADNIVAVMRVANALKVKSALAVARQ